MRTWVYVVSDSLAMASARFSQLLEDDSENILDSERSDNEAEKSVKPEDLDQDQNRKSGWKGILKKRRAKVFGVTAFTKKSSSSRPASKNRSGHEAKDVEHENLGNNTPEIAKSSRTHSTRSSVSSHEDLFSGDKEMSNLVGNKQPLDSSAFLSEIKSSKDSKSRPKLLSVVNSAKNQKSDRNSLDISQRYDENSSVQDEHCEDGIDELLGGKTELKEVSRHGKMKGVRKRLRSWRGKKQRSVSESDVIRAMEKENDDDDAKELLEAWFDSSDNGKDEKKAQKMKKHHSVGGVERKHASPSRRQSDILNIKKRGNSLGEKEKRKHFS